MTDAAIDLKQRRRPKPAVDRLPPHSEENEQGVLGCALIAPNDAIPKIRARVRNRQAFYDLRHQHIWDALLKMHDDLEGIDIATVQQRLKDADLLDQCGGIPYLAGLQDCVSSVVNLDSYLDIVLEKYRLRTIVQTCSEIVDRVYDNEGDIDDLMFSVNSDLYRLIDDQPVGGLTESASWSDLLEFDTEHDPNNVIGVRDGKTTRYLCKGHGAWLIGPSGVGKSALLLQLGIGFAAGLSSWGIGVGRPLRVLVVQAENDKGDIAEMAKGIEAGLNIGAFEQDGRHFDMVRENVKVISISGVIGQRFCGWLRKEIIAFRADLVLVDPLLSFAGIDVSRMDQASRFCREWLDPVLRETGAVLFSVHHTGKPPRERDRGGPQTIFDQAYSGIGSSELVNWARAIMLLQPAGDHAFRLVLAKRGKRAWATQPNGEVTQTLWLKHAGDGSIFWKQIDPPDESEQAQEARPAQPKEPKVSKPVKIASMNLHTFLNRIPEKGVGKREIMRMLSNWLVSPDSPEKLDVSDGTLFNAIGAMVTNGKLTKTVDDEGSIYHKGRNA